MTVRVRFSEAGEVATSDSQPTRPRWARRADGDAPFDDAVTRDCLPSQLGRTTGGTRESGFPRSSRQTRTAGAADGRGRRSTGGPPPPPSDACRRHVGLAEFPVYDPQTGVARDPRVTEAAMCVRLVDVRITCGLHDDAQIAAVFIDPRAK